MSAPPLMRAMQVHALGGPLTLDRVPRPVPGPDEVLLRVLACGVNFADTLLIKGKYQTKAELPFAPGMEICGVVESGAPALAPGTRVAALTGHGGFAEYVTVPAALCTPVPHAMSDTEAAGFLIAYGSSHLALDHRARLRSGETLLVLGAAGGVGLTAVEVGKLMGARVIASARGADRLAIAAAKGADHLIDAGADLRAEVKALGGYDVLYDPVGGDAFREAMRAARPEARLLPIGFASGDVPQIPANILLVKNLDVIGFWHGAYPALRPERLGASNRQLFTWYEEGRLKPHISNIVPLVEADAALDLLRSRAAMGKVVVQVAE